jgi:hypothetical protein
MRKPKQLPKTQRDWLKAKLIELAKDPGLIAYWTAYSRQREAYEKLRDGEKLCFEGECVSLQREIQEPVEPVQREPEPPPPKAPKKPRQRAPEKRKGRGPGKKPAKVTTSVQLDPDMVEALQVVAEREERTVSAVIRLAIRDYLERVK